MGAKRGRAKRNEQRSRVQEPGRKHEKSGWRERGNRGSESGAGHWGSSCEAEPGRAERKKQRLSSELLKRKRTEREAEVKHRPRRRNPKGDHLWNGCGSDAGQDERKQTAKPSTRTGKEGMRNQAGKNGESQEAKAEGRTGEATVRRKREERKGRSRGLSSRKGSGRDRKETEAERKGKSPKAKA